MQFDGPESTVAGQTHNCDRAVSGPREGGCSRRRTGLYDEAILAGFLNRYFTGADRWERTAETVKDACEHIALPRPSEVRLRPVSEVEGVPHAREFPVLAKKRDGGSQSRTHAAIVFEEPKAGPVQVGAGRFRGYGLCRPMDRRRLHLPTFKEARTNRPGEFRARLALER